MTDEGVKDGGSWEVSPENTVPVRDTAGLWIYPELPKDP
jgi:hypothetical protein